MGAPVTKRGWILTFVVAVATGMALGGAFSSGQGSLIANTSYVAGGSGGGSSCPVGPGWSTFPLGAPSTGFTAGGMAYDATDGYVVYFGGYTGSGYVGATWEYSGGCWKDLGVLSPSPDPRSEFAMAWDGADNEVLLFGGADAGTQCNATNSYYFYMCGDTWGFSGNQWHLICHNGDALGTGGASSFCSVTPPPMNAPMMTYDPVSGDCNQGGVSGATSGCVFLYGGLYCTTATCNTVNERDRDSGTIWEFFGHQWYRSTVTGATPRDFGGLTYDSYDGYVLLYGGENTSCYKGACTFTGGSCVDDNASTGGMSEYCDDAWSYSAGTWTPQCQGKADFAGHTDGACYPPGAVGNAMTFDGYENFVMDYGGFNGRVSYNDSDSHGYVYGAWEWEAGTPAGHGNWFALQAPPSSVALYGPAMVYDPGLQDSYVMVLGGSNAGGYTYTLYIYK